MLPPSGSGRRLPEAGLCPRAGRLGLRGSGQPCLCAHMHRHAVNDRAGAAGAGQALGPAALCFDSSLGPQQREPLLLHLFQIFRIPVKSNHAAGEINSTFSHFCNETRGKFSILCGTVETGVEPVAGPMVFLWPGTSAR